MLLECRHQLKCFATTCLVVKHICKCPATSLCKIVLMWCIWQSVCPFVICHHHATVYQQLETQLKRRLHIMNSFRQLISAVLCCFHFSHLMPTVSFDCLTSPKYNSTLAWNDTSRLSARHIFQHHSELIHTFQSVHVCCVVQTCLTSVEMHHALTCNMPSLASCFTCHLTGVCVLLQNTHCS